MTYCVAMRLDAGLVFLSDSRTNAGVDQINTFRKMQVFEKPGERMLVLLSAGNLSISQSVVNLLRERLEQSRGPNLHTVKNMFEAARHVGDCLREIHARDAQALRDFGIDFNASLILGGQIAGEEPRLFQIYAVGNFIEATRETPYFQIGESKYGKPILDRVITSETPIDQAAKCALISMDSTIKSNLTVGLPLDMLIYERDALKVGKQVTITAQNTYFNDLRNRWGECLRNAFEELPAPDWDASF
ncbi:MAG TPA: proteasome-type protease [Rhodocyclaceae bacterium]|uniref:proteasome-type protease n=1 Tax=Zoogloea sp. TaxID=49181 RepID=UPI002C7F86C9|nr:proteasome-type protease [Zoogloea sp.]HMV17394.1 proteasome-type protease [Rhodocyclaceae bacterium]HMV63556.1 proteasome-type protease [Rhodocyclaceae bacterium]HMW52042.1 proteasome-type protease [Rhodocyclaceae bacterium]HMZ76421.1 proteasome-type protease [Rhodocyclaceae bacterium]HNH17070.1 proteasome-type protease [Zoogloea sp.]